MKIFHRLMGKIRQNAPVASLAKMASHEYRLFLQHRKAWQAQGGNITKYKMILEDYGDNAGNNSGHYFHQDLLVANFVFNASPKRHIDIGSRVDGFVAHVASFRQIDVLDIRPLPPSAHENIRFLQADLMNPAAIEQADSVSCLHALEHFGLGRYTDPIDVNGHLSGIKNLINLVQDGGTLYISFPIGKADEVHFNAHRVFHPNSIMELDAVKGSLRLKRFDYVDDNGDLHTDQNIKDVVGKLNYGCGIYTFEKTAELTNSVQS